jgi:nitric oxide dioxygenase
LSSGGSWKASAVFAYAASIDNAQALGPVVRRIVHKHASVGIRAEHYPIVGHHLLGAIKEVLGDAATPALIAAWAEAYGELADALIRAEKDLYDRVGTTPGGLQALRVVAVNDESETIKSFVLEAQLGERLPAFKPGQYVSVSVSFPDGKTQLRQYSLSGVPRPDRLRISVKRETGKPKMWTSRRGRYQTGCTIK